MSEATPLDDRGRFTVEPRYRKMLGRRVIQIWTPHGLLLRPVTGRIPAGSLPPALSISGDDLYLEDEMRAENP